VVTVRVPIREQRDASYDIHIGTGLLDEVPGLLQRHCPAARYAIVADSTVAKLFGDRLAMACGAAGVPATVFTFPSGEWNKTRETWAMLSDRLLGAHVGRDAAVVALGGGVTGDVAGFVASTYLRGVPFVQIPTSLLAMIDSSIGGKTGVDVPSGKNLLGTLHQPRLVVADLAVLGSLPAAHLAAGLAEAVKHGVIADREYFDFLDRECGAILEKQPAALERVVRRSVEIKAHIVGLDERETGLRAVLNFGHTIGHAIEAAMGYEMLHGEAVAVGMALEARLAEALGVAEGGTADGITRLLERYRLPVTRPETVGPDALLELMGHDKKNRGGELRFALPRRIGQMHGDSGAGWTVTADEAAIRAALASP
jgi:3-dehydroquinate synthase